MIDETEFPPDYWQRFSGIARLYGRAALAKFRAAHVCIVGVGGVGSWVAEALARSGVGTLTLIDLDDICVTNVNRQLPALDGTIGKPKVNVLADRVRAINPEITVHSITEFLGESNADRLLHNQFSYLVDCVDRVGIKILQILRCKALGVPVVTMGGAGGRKDALQVKLCDLQHSSGDRLLRYVRKKLRAEYRFPRDLRRKFGVMAVYSDELQVFPWSDGTCRATAEEGENLRMDCASGFGAVTHVTAAFAMIGAGEVLRRLSVAAESRAVADTEA